MPIANVNKTALNYRFDGREQGPVVMISNSLCSDLTMWDNQVSVLVDAGYRVLRYDSRGHGQSDVPPGPYCIDHLAQDAVGLMDMLGLEKVHFCGLSMGGMVGQLLGARHGDRLISLVLSSTAAYMPPRESWDERMVTARDNGMGFLVKAIIDRWFTKPGQERLPKELEKVRRMILNTSVEGFCACCEAIRDMDLRGCLGHISIRTLVMVGEYDPGTPVSEAEFIHEQIPTSALQIISNAAHLVNVEQADDFNRILLQFLAAAGH